VEAQKIGKNESLEYFVDEAGILTIKIDTSKDIGPSASGKTTLIASSSGNAKINIGDREVFLGLNLYYK
jgi:ABC-type polar amino acid transport system ATPase subunit